MTDPEQPAPPARSIRMHERFRPASGHLVTAGLIVGAAAVFAVSRGAPVARVVPVFVPRVVEVAPPVPRTAIPTRPVPCVDATTRISTTDERTALVCWGQACLAYGASQTRGPREADPPEVRKPIEEPPSVTADAVCTGDRCTSLGPQLRAALVAARAQRAANGAPSPPTVRATRDHRVVMFRHDEPRAWDVARDRPIAIGHPPGYTPKSMFLVELTPIGDQLIAAWNGCAGPCGRASVVDRDGRLRGAMFEDGQLIQQDVDRFVMFGALGEVTVIDHGRATTLAGGMPAWAAGELRLADHGAAALAHQGASWSVVLVEGDHVRQLAELPHCEPLPAIE